MSNKIPKEPTEPKKPKKPYKPTEPRPPKQKIEQRKALYITEIETVQQFLDAIKTLGDIDYTTANIVRYTDSYENRLYIEYISGEIDNPNLEYQLLDMKRRIAKLSEEIKKLDR